MFVKLFLVIGRQCKRKAMYVKDIKTLRRLCNMSYSAQTQFPYSGCLQEMLRLEAVFNKLGQLQQLLCMLQDLGRNDNLFQNLLHLLGQREHLLLGDRVSVLLGDPLNQGGQRCHPLGMCSF